MLHLKFTFPVGGTDPDVVTVAVQVTDSPYMLGFRLERRVVAVADLVVEFTTWRSAGEVLAAKLASPG
jgi:hypothetical protein